MKPTTMSFEGFMISVPESWGDITESVQAEVRPFTVAKADGVGALQFSPALYAGGALPEAASEDLAAMLDEFCERHNLQGGFDPLQYNDALTGIGTSFHSADAFIRVWYLTDGKNFMLATYVCDWHDRGKEASDFEDIVRSIHFDNSTCE